MKIKYMGKYSGDENSLPSRPHREGYVPFREVQDVKRFAIVINIIGGFVLAVLIGIDIFVFRLEFLTRIISFEIGFILAIVLMIPHEYLHGLCFREESYVYTNLKQGMLFIVGFEDMHKSRFVWLSLCPNICFGFIPFGFGLILHQPLLAAMGTVGIAAGVGDYYNVYNCLIQVPKGALVYMYGMHSFWYQPEKDSKKNSVNCMNQPK